MNELRYEKHKGCGFYFDVMDWHYHCRNHGTIFTKADMNEIIAKRTDASMVRLKDD